MRTRSPATPTDSGLATQVLGSTAEASSPTRIAVQATVTASTLPWLRSTSTATRSSPTRTTSGRTGTVLTRPVLNQYRPARRTRRARDHFTAFITFLFGEV